MPALVQDVLDGNPPSAGLSELTSSSFREQSDLVPARWPPACDGSLTRYRGD